MIRIINFWVSLWQRENRKVSERNYGIHKKIVSQLYSIINRKPLLETDCTLLLYRALIRPLVSMLVQMLQNKILSRCNRCDMFLCQQAITSVTGTANSIRMYYKSEEFSAQVRSVPKYGSVSYRSQKYSY